MDIRKTSDGRQVTAELRMYAGAALARIAVAGQVLGSAGLRQIKPLAEPIGDCTHSIYADGTQVGCTADEAQALIDALQVAQAEYDARPEVQVKARRKALREEARIADMAWTDARERMYREDFSPVSMAAEAEAKARFEAAQQAALEV